MYISMGFIEYFKLIEAPQSSNRTGHSLIEIIFISVCAYICGANSWDGVYEFAKARIAWLRKFIGLKNGIPSRVTYWRAFTNLNPHSFQKSFQEWSNSLTGPTRHIAIDGKALRGVYDPNNPIERFLVRLCRVLLAKHFDIGRETSDLDFSVTNLSNHPSVLQPIIEEVIRIDVGDGFAFTNVVITPLEQFHMHYAGARMRIDVNFGRARFPLFVDLGFGDLVKPHSERMSLLFNSKGPLFEASVEINCYPLEFVLAEKLETAVYRGAENSRMKDYHDLLTLTQRKSGVRGLEAEKAIVAVFQHRNTALRLPLPVDPGSTEVLQAYWTPYLKTLAHPDSLPRAIETVLSIINGWLNANTSLCSRRLY
jgi:hypothetical protein